jgi:hypothetical protein
MRPLYFQNRQKGSNFDFDLSELMRPIPLACSSSQRLLRAQSLFISSRIRRGIHDGWNLPELTFQATPVQ